MPTSFYHGQPTGSNYGGRQGPGTIGKCRCFWEEPKFQMIKRSATYRVTVRPSYSWWVFPLTAMLFKVYHWSFRQLCVCVCMYVHMCEFMHTCMHVGMESIDQIQVSSLIASLPYLLRQGFWQSVELPKCSDWLSSGPRESFSPCPHRTGITGMHCHTEIFTHVQEIWTWVLKLVQQTFYLLSYSFSPQIMLKLLIMNINVIKDVWLVYFEIEVVG